MSSLDGTTEHLPNMENQGAKMVTVLWVTASVPVLFVALRLYIRVWLRHSYGIDDTVILVSSVLLLVYAAVMTKSTDYGVGMHYYDITDPAKLVIAYKYIYVGQPIAIMACSLSKSSFGLMLLRVVNLRWEKILIWSIIASINIIMFLTALFQFVQCKNPAYGWDRSIKTECWPIEIFTWFAVAAGAYSGTCDFVLAIWPWFILNRLQMKAREKFGIGCAMSLGVFAGVCAMIKTSHLPALSKQADYTWYGCDVLLWAAAETGLTIVASCMATFRPLLRIFIDIVTSARDENSDYYVLDRMKKEPGSKDQHCHNPEPGRRTEQVIPYWSDTLMSKTMDVENVSQVGSNSDRSILPNPKMSDKKISKTMDVKITYSERMLPRPVEFKDCVPQM